jgi:hypothetical protein
MKKPAKLQAAILAALASSSYAYEDCGTSVTECRITQQIEDLQRYITAIKTQVDTQRLLLDSQQKQIAFLTTENQRLRQKTDAFSVSSDGKVGIGTTSPVGKLTLKNADRIVFDNDAPGHSDIGWREAGVWKAFVEWHKGALRFYTGGGSTSNVRMAITEGGNVGIGTMVPTEKLQVNGNVKATAFKTGDIFFEKDGETLWQMFEDEHGLYVKHLKTGETYRFVLEKVQ